MRDELLALEQQPHRREGARALRRAAGALHAARAATRSSRASRRWRTISASPPPISSARSTRSRAASAAASSWPRCCSRSRTCCSSTSRPTTSTSRPPSTSRSGCASGPRRSCWSRTIATSCARCAARSSRSRAGKVGRLPGRLRPYVVEREERHERLNAAYERQEAEIARTEDFIRRNIAGQKTKQAQVAPQDAREARAAGAPRRTTSPPPGNIGLRFSVGDHPGGKEALKAEHLDVGYPGAPPLVRDVDLIVYRGDRVGIVGPNGCGKSTLLKTLLGKLEPLGGAVVRGHEVRIGYFDQKLSDLDEERSLIDEIRTVRGDFNEDVARNFLGRFRFTGDDGVPEGQGPLGRRAQPADAGQDDAAAAQPARARRADQPPRHPGARGARGGARRLRGHGPVVSHDRYFLDRVVTKIVHIHDGRAELHVGNYTDWKDARQREAAKPRRRRSADESEPETPASRSTKNGARVDERERKKAQQRELDKKQKRLQELEEKIAAAESGDRRAQRQAGRRPRRRLAEAARAGRRQREDRERLKSWMSEWERLGTSCKS